MQDKNLSLWNLPGWSGILKKCICPLFNGDLCGSRFHVRTQIRLVAHLRCSLTKKGRRITWYYSNKLKNFPPSKPDDDLDDNDDGITDEEDPES